MIKHSLIGPLLKKIVISIDPELRDIRDLIMNKRYKSTAEMSSSFDHLFEERLRKNPLSLKMSFWKNHFEWKAVSQFPEIKDRILDFGCGTGHSDIFLARAGKSIHGIDASGTAIRIANHLKNKESEDVKALLSFQCVDVTSNLPSEEPFDSVWSSQVFEHIEEPGHVIKGLGNWVKPGAYFLVSVPLGYAFDDPGHVHHFRDGEDLRIHLGKHIDVVKVEKSPEFPVIRALCRFP